MPMSKARAVRPELLTLLVSLAFLLFYNLPLWQRLLAITPAGWQGLGMMLAIKYLIDERSKQRKAQAARAVSVAPSDVTGKA